MNHYDSFENKNVQEHFDQLASSYDLIKKRNWYYLQSVKKVIREVVPPNKRVLEIGTGTGEVLNYLKPSYGVGLDISPRMIACARQKYPHLEFHAVSYENFETTGVFDFIILADVIEHLPAPSLLFRHLSRFSSNKTRIIITMANPIWEPILSTLEKLHLKMEEGPHYRITDEELILYANKDGFNIASKNRYLIFPMYIPGLSKLLNNGIGKLPLVNRLSLIMRFCFQHS